MRIRSDKPSPRFSGALLLAAACAVLVGAGQVASCAGDSEQAEPGSTVLALPAELTEASASAIATEPQAQDGCPDPDPVPEREQRAVPLTSTQLIRVTSGSWKDFSGTLQRYERRCPGSPWEAVGEPRPVMLGRHGMGWGRGLHPDGQAGPIKMERDQRSPAGVFDLGEARGYAKEPPPGTTWPFQHSGSAWRCMDNPASEAYNTFIPTGGYLTPTPPGMAPREVIFDLMVFVLHNTDPVQRGAGSCVFLHVWSKQGTPTQGCVAMARDSIGGLLAWLSLDRHPVLAQLPTDVLERVGADWDIPVAPR